MPLPDLRIGPLDDGHDRAAFSSGVASLDRYLHTQAKQDLRRKANAVFVLSAGDTPSHILGYYTLCALAVAQGDIPPAARKHVPRYPLVSATLIGRLAVDRDAQGRGLGSILVADALHRSHASAGTVGSSMIVVDALNDAVASFYEAYGFVRLPESLRLILPMVLAREAAP